MPPRDWKLRIEDILDAIERIQRYTAGFDLEGFTADQMTIDAVVRNIEIIGEAARYIPVEVERRHQGIPWATMRGIRNRLIHGYAEVDVDIIWRTCRDNLPPVVPLLRQVLQDGG